MCVTFGGDTAVSQHRILSNYLYSLVGAGAGDISRPPEPSEYDTGVTQCDSAPSSSDT